MSEALVEDVGVSSDNRGGTASAWARAMLGSWGTLFALGALGAFALSGCSLSKSCTSDLRGYTVEMTRELPGKVAANQLVVEGCSDSSCESATPEAGGAITFRTSPTSWGARDGAILEGESGKERIRVRFGLFERGTRDMTTLKLRVKSGDAVLLDERAELRWVGIDDDCHTAPASTTL